MSADALIRLQDVSVKIGGHQILSDISMTIRRGEIVTVLGPNGSGKTTLMRVIIGALPPSSGDIHREPGLRLAYVPQRLSVDPSLPINATRFLNLPQRRDPARVAAALDRAGLTMADLDVIELNEAFAAQALGVTREWGIDPIADERVNPNGSGISLGHPVGATGVRILATMLREMERREARYGLETMRIGGGQGLAAVFERLS